MSDDQHDAFDLLDQAIEACHELEPADHGTPVDAVLIVGVQHIEDDGARTGHVEVYPRSGAQPAYVTRGLIGEARKLLDQAIDDATEEDQ